MNKYNNDRSRDKIDSILYRARKNEVDKILGETFKICGCFFVTASAGKNVTKALTNSFKKYMLLKHNRYQLE